MTNKICINKTAVYLTLILLVVMALPFGLSGKKTVNTEASRNMIINGTNVVPNEFPYFVRLYIDTPYINTKCGGTLINKDYVLTARHCTDLLYQNNNSKLTILIGVDNYVTTDKSVLGHYYDLFTYSNLPDNIFYPSDYGDISLIKLKKEALNIPYLSIPPPINSPEYKKLNIVDGLNMTAIGAGYISDVKSLSSDYLLKTKLILQIPKINLSKLKQLHLISDPSGGNTCGGDSGGPVILSRKNKQYVIGVTVNGKDCDRSNSGFYTSVADYSNWITNVTNRAILPDTGTVKGDANIKYFPPQKQLGLICKNFKTISDCNNNSVICQWNNSCSAK